MDNTWKESELYRQGVFHKRLGEILMNPKSSVEEIAKLAFEYNMNPAFIFREIDNIMDKDKDNGV